MQSGIQPGLPLSIKMLITEPWRKKINTSCQSFSFTRRPGQGEPFFCFGSIGALSLKSGNTLPVRDCLLKFFWYCTMPPGHPEPPEFKIKSVKVVYLPPNKMLLIRPLDQVFLMTFKAHWKELPVLWKRMLIEYHENQEGLQHERCHCCYRKSHESHRAWNDKFLLKNTGPQCYEWLHRI